MDFIFLGTGSANGYDALGHFLRAEGVGNALPRLRSQTPPRTRAASANCSATPAPPRARRVLRRRLGGCGAGTTSVLMARTLAVIKGATPAQALAKYPGLRRRAPAKLRRRA